MTMTKKKKGLIAVLSITLIAVITAGTTFAYLFNKSAPVSNVFTFSGNISAELDEPSWDPEEGLDLVPGSVMEKDPQITNTSKNTVDIYAAVKMTFKNGAGDVLTDDQAEKLMGLITIDWGDTGYWVQIQGDDKNAPVQIWRYNTAVKPLETTNPLFYSVTINDDVTPEDLEWLAGIYGHTDDCYVRGDCTCDQVTYIHHVRCPIAGEEGAEHVKAGGSLGDKTCDCKAASQHEAGCPYLIGHIPENARCHTVLQKGDDGILSLGNFQLVVEGAVVQADAFNDTDEANAPLIELLTDGTIAQA